MYQLMNVYLENGLKIVLHKIIGSKTAGCGIWIKQGSKYERDNTSGLSHLLEHLIVTSNNNQDEKNLLDEVEENGVVYNATTTKEFTSYYFSGISETLDFIIDTLSELITIYKPVSSDVFENEKKIVLREAAGYYGSFQQISERSAQALWGNVDVGRIIVGDTEVIKNATQDTICEMYHEGYTPDNATLVVVGNFEYNDVLKRIQNKFGSWEDKPHQREIEPVNRDAGIYVNSQSSGENALVSISFKIPEYSSIYRSTIEVVSLILGDGGIKSRLAKEIRMKRGLAYIVNSFESFYEDRGLIGFASVCSPKSVTEVVSLMVNEILKCKMEGFSEHEIESAKRKLITKRLLGLENISDHLKFLGKSAVYGTTFSVEQEIRNIQHVNSKSIRYVLDHVFHDNNVSLAAIGDVNVDELVGLIAFN